MPQAIAWIGNIVYTWVYNWLGSNLVAYAAQQVVVAAIYAGLSYGLSAAASMGRAKPGMPSAQDGKVGIRQATASRASGYGRARWAGVYVCYEERAGHSFDILAFHDGEIDAVERHFLMDDEVNVIGGYVQATAEGAYGGNRVTFRTNLGPNPNVAFSETVGNLADIWTAQHRGDGVACMELICRSVAQQDIARIYPNGLPSPSVVFRAQKVFDPRDASQSYANKASWRWRDNPVLCLMHFLCDANSGMGYDFTRRIQPSLSYWIAAANICDEQVALKAGGTERRYRCGGMFLHDSDPIVTVDMLLTTFDGWLCTRGDGALIIRAGKFYTPTVTITSDHIVEFSTTRNVPDEDAINELIVGYTSPFNYMDVECEPWIDEEDKAARGKDRVQSVEVVWCQSRSQARRLAKRQVMRANSKAQGWVRTNMFGRHTLGERFIRIQNPTLPSLADITVEVTGIEFDLMSLSQTISFVRCSADIDDWNAATEEGSPETNPVIAGGVLPPTPTGVSGNALYATSGLDVVSLAVRVVIDATARDDLGYVIGFGVRGTGAFTDVTLRREDAIDSGDGKLIFIVANTAIRYNTYYISHVATVAPGGTYSTFVEIETFTFEESAGYTLPPPPPIAISVVGGVGEITCNFNSPDFDFHYSSICYIAEDGETIFDSTLGFEETQARNTADTVVITGKAPGVYQLWFLTRRDGAAGQLSQFNAGPFEVTVT
jgi:hypothetical protein